MKNLKNAFKLYGKYYDIIYKKKNYQKETIFIDKLLKKFNLRLMKYKNYE